MTARAENEAARVAAQAGGLPNLTGTDKQVAWACRLRQETLDALATEVVTLARSFGVHGDTTAFVAMVRACLPTETDARWWIDQRAYTAHTLAVYALRTTWTATGLPRAAVSIAIRAGLLPDEAQCSYESDPTVVDTWQMLAALTSEGTA